MKKDLDTATARKTAAGKSGKGAGSRKVKKDSQALEELKSKIGELEAEKQEWNDRWARTAAEYDNYRKRTQKERMDLVNMANEGLIEELLEVLDDFQNAIDTAPKEGDAQSFAKGVQLIFDKMKGILSRRGLEAIEAENQPFDPNLHDALMVEHSTEVPDDHVVREIQRGFKLGGRIIRPAKVCVSRGIPDVEQQ